MFTHLQIEQERIDFFPQKAALKLKHRDADITTEDVVKKVDKASNDLEAEISAQARDARDAVVSQLSKKLAQSEELRHMKDEMEKKFEDELEHMKNEMQQKFEDVHEKFVNVQQTLVREQALFGQEFASIHTAMQTILHRLPAEVCFYILNKYITRLHVILISCAELCMSQSMEFCMKPLILHNYYINHILY